MVPPVCISPMQIVVRMPARTDPATVGIHRPARAAHSAMGKVARAAATKRHPARLNGGTLASRIFPVGKEDPMRKVAATRIGRYAAIRPVRFFPPEPTWLNRA
jgi:hypothetical protein